MTRTNAALFMTRWITHICAPVFVFLAGVAAFLSLSGGKTKRELARFLLLRGLLLIVLELTIVRFGWFFNFDYHFVFVQVIWVLGWSMIALAGLIFLPNWLILLFGIVMIAGHNLFDGTGPESLGSFSWLWTVLHSPGMLQPQPGVRFFVLYPLIPWIGVMALGYGIGPLFLRERGERRRWLLGIGAGLILAFIVLRAINQYGDPRPWSPQSDTLFTVFSFINTEKYPPSLLFLLMTLGPALIALALFDRRIGRIGRPFVIFGRVPLFFYLVHLPLIHLSAVGIALARSEPVRWLFDNPRFRFPDRPVGTGFDLPVVYLIWLIVVLILFPVCRWFVRIKQTTRNRWLRYL